MWTKGPGTRFGRKYFVPLNPTQTLKRFSTVIIFGTEFKIRPISVSIRLVCLHCTRYFVYLSFRVMPVNAVFCLSFFGKSSITPTNSPRKPEFSNRLKINSVKRNTQESEIATYVGSYCKLYKTGLNLHRCSLNRKLVKIICFPRLFRKKKVKTLSDQTFIFCLLNKMLQFNITIFKRNIQTTSITFRYEYHKRIFTKRIRYTDNLENAIRFTN